MSDEMDEIWALYLDDGTQSLDQMEAALLALQDGDAATAGEHVSALFRAVHTFKGNSRVLGLAVVESRAHYSEDLIGLVRDDGVPLDEEIIDILLLASDVLRDMLEQTSASRSDVDPASSEDLMQQLKSKIARCKGEDEPMGDEPAAEAPAAEAPAEEAVAEEAPAEEPVAEPKETAAPVSKMPDISDAMASLGDVDSNFGDDDFFEDEAAQTDDLNDTVADVPDVSDPVVAEDPAPETVAEAPVVEPAAEEPAAAAPAPAAPSTPKRLIDDPTYKDIFRGMAEGALTKFRQYMGDYAGDVSGTYALAKRQADDLHHAAGQMGLNNWCDVLKLFMDQPEADADTGVEQIAALVLKIEELTAFDLSDEPQPVAAPAEGEETFFDRLKDVLHKLAKVALDWTTGDAPEVGSYSEEVKFVVGLADERGLVRVADAAKRLTEVNSAKAFRSAELRLYEELAAVERVLTEEAAASSVSPSELLRHWCAEHAFDTLSAVDHALDGIKKGENVDEQYSAFARQMRLVFHACEYHKLGTAGQLAMSLIDLFGRVQTSGIGLDGILMHIARGFIDTIELVFDALEQGEIPDTQNLDILFEQASTAAFSQEGVLTATAIERRLQLPDEFHRVLSPDSVRAASKAIEAGHHFYVIRTDINNDETLAERFLEWISGDNVESITNVTVFRDAETLFDFLVSTPMDNASVITALTEMDPSGKYLELLHTLEDQQRGEDGGADRPASKDGDQPIGQGPGLSSEMLEAISEVAASQAMVNHMLSDLAETGLAESIEVALRVADQNPAQSRDMVRKIVGDFSARLQETVQVESQLVGQLAHLQEQTVAIRSRPLELLIRPLEALVETLSRRNRGQASMTSSGGEMSIDVTLMEHLRKMLRTMLTDRLSAGDDVAPNAIHMAFQRDDERVLVTIDDDGKSSDTTNLEAELAPMLKATSAELRKIVLPGNKGLRFHISMPLSMVVLEGMVVGVGGIRYVIPVDTIQTIIQPQPKALRPISAANGRVMLRMEDGSMVSVHHLNDSSVRALKEEDENGQRRVFVVLGVGERRLAIPVDDLLGQQLVLLRPLRGVLRQMRNLNGIALLAGGEVGMVLSTNSLLSDASEAA